MPELILANNCISDYKIMIDANAAEPELFAAEELQKYIFLIAGVKLPIEKNLVADKVIFVGSKFIDRSDMRGDAFIIKTRQEQIILGGNTFRATLFSVYAFLEKYLGCGWCMPGDDTVPKKNRIAVSELDDLETPAFSYRGLVNYPYEVQRTIKEIDWAAKNRLNWSHVAFNNSEDWEQWKDADSKNEFISELKKRGFNFHFGGHSSFELAPPDKYFKSHPEYYSLLNGKRNAFQVCISNPEVVSLMANNIKKLIKETPETDVVDLWMEDRNYWCDCADCQMLEEKQHSLFWNIYPENKRNAMFQAGFPGAGKLYSRSKSYLTFVNKIAEEVAEEYPRVMINYLAYSNLSDFPEDVAPGKNVLIGFAPLERTWSEPLNSQNILSNQAFSSVLEKWAAKTKQLYIYAYYGDVAQAIAPVIKGDIEYYHQLGIDKIACESAYWHEQPNWFGLNLYVYAKLTWNPEKNWRELVADFCNRYYGKAALPMKKQWMRIHEVKEQWGRNQQGNIEWKKHGSECRAYIEEAKSLADNDLFLSRIKVIEKAWEKIMAEEDEK